MITPLIHPTALAFAVRDAGFVAVETQFLHPREGYVESTDAPGPPSLASELMWSIRGPQDYAIVGRKPAEVSRVPL